MTYRSEDLLADVLSGYRLTASVFRHDDWCGRWQVNTSGSRRTMFHLIGRGACWLHLKGRGAPVALAGGDLVVFPHDAWHVLTPTPARPRSGATAFPAGDAEGPVTNLLCGYFDFGVARNPILEALPEMIHIRCEQTPAYARLESLARLILAEAEAGDDGQHLVLGRLADALFVMVLRAYVGEAKDRRGLLAALADARVSKALAAAHREPGRPWTVESLAHAAGMSRTAFSVTFGELVGEPPLRYLTALRMRRAAELLQDRGRSVAAVAEELGYETEAAFRRAFKRVQGVGPGAVRRGRNGY